MRLVPRPLYGDEAREERDLERLLRRFGEDGEFARLQGAYFVRQYINTVLPERAYERAHEPVRVEWLAAGRRTYAYDAFLFSRIVELLRTSPLKLNALGVEEDAIWTEYRRYPGHRRGILWWEREWEERSSYRVAISPRVTWRSGVDATTLFRDQAAELAEVLSEENPAPWAETVSPRIVQLLRWFLDNIEITVDVEVSVRSQERPNEKWEWRFHRCPDSEARIMGVVQMIDAYMESRSGD